MADHIAKSLLVALPSSEPLSAAAENALDDDPKIQNGKLEKWSDELECILLTNGGVQRFREDPTMDSPAMNEAGNGLHRAILKAAVVVVVPQGDADRNLDWDDDDETAANEATEEFVDALPGADSLDGTNNEMDLGLLASLLRAIGLFLRWNSQVALIQSSDDVSKSCVSRLKFKSMVLLYAKCMDTEIPSTQTSPTTTNAATTPATDACPDVPRFAAICLFRATYGDDPTTSTARKLFVHSLDGCSYLMRALLRGGQPVPRLFSVVRNVHHLIAACPKSIPKMEMALKTLTAVDGDNDEIDNDDDTEQRNGLSEALVATLAWAYRSDPPFPGNNSDRRPDLVLEILRALYALDNTGNDPSKSRPSDDTMNVLAAVLCELLRFSNANERVYQIKLAVVTLLLNAPEGYGQYLVTNDGIAPLVDVLSRQTSLVVIERNHNSSDDAATVVPVTLALLRLVKTNDAARRAVKDVVFPPGAAEEAFARRASAEVAKGVTEGASRAKNMAPLDAPRGTLRWRLVRLMTWVDSNVKRSACELLWMLCGEDATEFVLRTGFGNAIHFLGIRGCVNLPAGVDG